MSILDNIKQMAGDAISKNIQNAVSNNAQDLINTFLQGKFSPESLKEVTNVFSNLIGTDKENGINNLVSQFDNANLGNLIQSWISSGKNLPFSMEQVSSVFGSDWIKSVADKININSSILTAIISQFLPSVVNEATQDGHANINTKGLDIGKILTSFLK